MPSATWRATVVACGEQRADEAALPQPRERDRFVQRAVRHDGVHRAERFDVVRLGALEWRVAVEQRRREERALLRIGADDVEAGRDRRTRAPRRRAASSALLRDLVTWARPARGPMRTPSTRRVADLHPGEPLPSASETSSTIAVRHEGAADGGALLPRLHRHLLRDFLDEQVELLGAGRGIGAEHARS